MSVAIIGAGIAGLSAAIDAADAGRDVVMFDARANLGGRARTRSEHGFRLNEGAHALYVDGPAHGFLCELGCEPPGGVPDSRSGLGIDGEVAGRLPTGIWSLLRTPLLKGDRVRLLRLFAGLGRLDPSSFATLTVDETVEQLLGRGPAARLGHALLRLSSYGNDPRHASGDFGLVQLKMAVGGGVRYLDNGWQTIVDSLEAEAASRGVEIRSGIKVASVNPEGGGVDLDVGESTERFDAVVVAAGGPRNVSAVLGDHSPDAAGWATASRPARVAALDVGLDVPWGDAVPFALGIDRPLYLSVHAPVAQLAPAGHTLVHVSRYLDPDEPDDAERDRGECEHLLDRIRPGWRNNAVHVGFSRRLVAAFDQPKAATGGLAGRPEVAVPGLDGVFVAGDWVGPAGVLADASVASGRAAGAAAAAIVREAVVR